MTAPTRLLRAQRLQRRSRPGRAAVDVAAIARRDHWPASALSSARPMPVDALRIRWAP